VGNDAWFYVHEDPFESASLTVNGRVLQVTYTGGGTLRVWDTSDE
jgi:hypothetical protein